jgi:hypothetical protein
VAENETLTKPRPGEWAVTLFMLVFFAAGYFFAQDYPFRAALFPQMVSVLGLALTVLRVIGLIRETVRFRRAPAPAPASAAATAPVAAGAGAVTAQAATGGETVGAVAVPSELELVDDDREDDASMEYVFASAGGRAWVEALAWIVAFFIAFFVLGAFLAVPLFAFFYLRFSGRTSWLAAIIYAAVTGVLIYLVFRELVYIPLPESIFPFLQI